MLCQTEKVKKALEIATAAHAGQKRWGGEDYITHPIAVAESLDFEEGQILGLLHDVLEDTKVTSNELADEFGEDIVFKLMVLTKQEGEEYYSYIQRVAAGPHICPHVKLADLEHNLRDLKPGPRKDKYQLARLYLIESICSRYSNADVIRFKWQHKVS